MPVSRSTPALDRLRQFARTANGRYRLVIQAPESEQAKLFWLSTRGRDMLAVTPSMQQAIVRYLRVEFLPKLVHGEVVNDRQFLSTAAEAIKAHVLLRFRNNGNDVSLRPLTRAYVERKARKGLDPRIGMATHALYNALDAAVWSLRKGG